jgi:hypothetical protein
MTSAAVHHTAALTVSAAAVQEVGADVSIRLIVGREAFVVRAAASTNRATAAAIPTPAPNQLVSRAAGRIVAISAEEQAGQLIVTLGIAP